MSLEKQIIPIAFGQGIDTKTDVKKAILGKPFLLENAVMGKQNHLDKRPGRRLLSTKDISGNELSGGQALSTFKDELLQFNKHKLYSYSPSIERWVNRGTCISSKVKTRQIFSNQVIQADSAVNKNIGVYAWNAVGGNVKAIVMDEVSGTILLSSTVLEASASNVRCLAFKDYLYVFYYKSNSVYCRRLNPLSPQAFDAAIEVSSTVLNDGVLSLGYYDVINYQNIRMVLAHGTQASSTVTVKFLDESLNVLSGDFAAKTHSGTVYTQITIVEGPESTFYLAFQESTAIKCYILNLLGSKLYGPITIESTADPIYSITGVKKRDGSGVTFYYSKVTATLSNQDGYIYKNTISSAGSAGVASLFLRSVSLASKAFSYYFEEDSEDHAYMAVTHDSNLQATYFLVRSDGVVVAKMQASLAANNNQLNFPVSINELQEGKFSYVLLNKTRIDTEAVSSLVNFSDIGIARTEIDFSARDLYRTADISNNLHITGGVLNMYDGQSVVEHGFHLYPEGVTATTVSGSGLVAGKSYQIIALYEWTDGFGQIHRSAPSIPYTLSIAGGVTNLKLSVTVPTLRLTEKKGTDRNKVSIVVYRTEADASDIFYRVTSVTSPTLNDTTTDSVTIQSTMTDATLISKEILYTTGGILENMSAPSCSDIEIYKNRIFLSGLEQGGKIEFSKEALSGEPIAFNPGLSLEVEPLGGDVISTSVLDDKLVIFKRDRYYVTGGDGPNDTGLGGEFYQPEFISSEIGAESSLGIVRHTNGLMLKTKKGIYLIDSSLRASYIGAPVDAFNGLEISSAVLKSDVNQVRFTSFDGQCLMYDYFSDQWSTFTNYQSNGAVIWNNKYVTLSSLGEVMWEDPTYFKDHNTSYRIKVGIGWISFAGVAGCQRIYKLHVLGDYYSPHLLKLSLSYDFSETVTSNYVFDPVTGLEITSFGEDSPFGESEEDQDKVFGGLASSYQFEAGLDYQKCQSVRIILEEMRAEDQSLGQSLSLTELSVLAGLKRGMAKLRSGQKIASS